jgi:putative Holliday junction resolvase
VDNNRLVSVIAIDLGTVRAGVAVADELGLLAHPRPFVEARNRRKLLDTLASLAESESASRFVVGLPRTLNGGEGSAARRARRFAQELQRRTGLPVELVDERWTTREAAARLRDQGMDSRAARSRIDSAAAAVLLQSWLDAHSDRDP